jgi:Laminin G domain.
LLEIVNIIKICVHFISDFISLELERGMPRLLIDFGSGTLELRVKTKNSLDDGEWHRIDVFWDTEV